MRLFVKEWLLPPKIFKMLQYYRAWIKNYKDNTQVNKEKNDRLRDVHTSDRCFIVATGPSIKEQDLTLLNKELVIGVSGLFQHKDIELIRPTYYVLPPVFRGHGSYYDESDFVSWMKDMDRKLSDDVIMFLDVGDKKYIIKHNIFSNKNVFWINYLPWEKDTLVDNIDLLSMPAIFSVSEAALQVAIYLGFKEIYLLGFDHSWQDDIWKHFSDDYMKHFDEKKLNSCKGWVDSEHEMIRHANIFSKYKMLYGIKRNIYNANANLNTYVDTFPKVKFCELFRNDSV